MKKVEKYFDILKNEDIYDFINTVSLYFGVSKNGKLILCQSGGVERCNDCIFEDYKSCEDTSYNYFAEEVEE